MFLKTLADITKFSLQINSWFAQAIANLLDLQEYHFLYEILQ